MFWKYAFREPTAFSVSKRRTSRLGNQQSGCGTDRSTAGGALPGTGGGGPGFRAEGQGMGPGLGRWAGVRYTSAMRLRHALFECLQNAMHDRLELLGDGHAAVTPRKHRIT